MDYWDYEEKLTALQVAWRDWAVRNRPNAFVTLTFGHTPLLERRPGFRSGVSYANANRIFGSFAHALKSHYFGSKSKKRMFMLPVVEGSGIETGGSPYTLQDSTHIHLIATLPQAPADAKDLVRSCWIGASSLCGDPRVHCPNDDAWCQTIGSPEAKMAATQYALKSCTINTDNVLVKYLTHFPT